MEKRRQISLYESVERRNEAMDIKKLEQMGMEQGFSHVALLDCDTIELKQEVRQMCAADTCHKYGKCWSCRT